MPGENRLECPIVDAVSEVHVKFREMTMDIDCPEGEKRTVDGFSFEHNSVSWEASCVRCAGRVAVKHKFSNTELEEQVEVDLPDDCPKSPSRVEGASHYYVEIAPRP